MKPLQPVSISIEEVNRNVAAYVKQWKAGEPILRECFNACSEQLAEAMIREHFNRIHAEEKIFLNDVYQVSVLEYNNGVHLSIKRIDRRCIHDWRDLQEIKNQLLGPECEAAELYPAESRRVDSANQYHLFGMRDVKFRFPFGFNQGRIVSDVSIGKSVNRKL